MNLYQTQQRIFENEKEIQTIVLKGINNWNREHNVNHKTNISVYAIPLIRYAIEDWMDEYKQSSSHHPDVPFGEYVKDQESNLVFHFKWALTHKAETIYRKSHAILWNALTEDEQKGFISGLRYLIEQTK